MNEIRDILSQSESQDRQAQEALLALQKIKETGIFEERQKYAERALKIHTDAKSTATDLVAELSNIDQLLEIKVEMF